MLSSDFEPGRRDAQRAAHMSYRLSPSLLYTSEPAISSRATYPTSGSLSVHAPSTIYRVIAPALVRLLTICTGSLSVTYSINSAWSWRNSFMQSFRMQMRVHLCTTRLRPSIVRTPRLDSRYFPGFLPMCRCSDPYPQLARCGNSQCLHGALRMRCCVRCEYSPSSWRCGYGCAHALICHCT